MASDESKQAPPGEMETQHQVDELEKQIDPSRAAHLVSQHQQVSERLAKVANGREVRLVAVSKFKAATDILSLLKSPASQIQFGENYAQELSSKAESLPKNIQWHFIGNLQSTHIKTLASIPNLFCVSSIESIKKANLLNKARGNSFPSLSFPSRLNIHIQINTSSESTKSGCAPGSETIALARHVLRETPHLRLLGFMTIGAIARSRAGADGGEKGGAKEENEDFACLREQRDAVVAELGPRREGLLTEEEAAGLELSMGMSNDFELAVKMGSNEVRVGSTIFGAR